MAVLRGPAGRYSDVRGVKFRLRSTWWVAGARVECTAPPGEFSRGGRSWVEMHREWSRGDSNPRAAQPEVLKNRDLRESADSSAAKSAAAGSDPGDFDPDLAAVIGAWPTLSDPVRMAITALVDAARK